MTGTCDHTLIDDGGGFGCLLPPYHPGLHESGDVRWRSGYRGNLDGGRWREDWTPESVALLASVARGQVCCFCGASAGIQADHVRPRHAGGESIPVNLAPLCGPCNQLKSCYWPGHGYHPLPGLDDPATADAILDAEIMWLRRHHGEQEITEHLWIWYGQPDGCRAVTP